MVLLKKLWCYTENYGTSIYEGKKRVDYQKLRNVHLQCIIGKKYGNVPKQFKLLNKFIALEL